MKTIKDLPEHSRPREKLRERGASSLTESVFSTRAPFTPVKCSPTCSRIAPLP